MKKLLFILFFPLTLLATDNYWTPLIDNNYGTAGNWSLVTVPDVTVNAFFTNVANELVTFTANQTASNAVFMAISGTKTINVTDGFQWNVNGRFTVANAPGQNTEISITNTGTIFVTNAITVVGSNGVGQVNQSLGSLICTNGIIGNLGGSSGTYFLSGGSNTYSGSLFIGNLATSTGVYTVAGGVLFSTNGNAAQTQVRIGASSFGTLNVSNGFVTVANANVGTSSGSIGIWNIYGGTNIISFNTFTIANSVGSIGLMNIQGGLYQNTNSNCIVGNSGIGTVTQSSGTAFLNAIIIGNAFNGSYVLSGGIFTNINTLVIGNINGSTGNMLITSGPFAFNSGSARVGESGVGKLTISNSSLYGSLLSIGNLAAGRGNLILDSGIVTNTSTFSYGTNAITRGSANILMQNGSSIFASSGVQGGGQSLMTVSNGGNIVKNGVTLASPLIMVGSLNIK